MARYEVSDKLWARIQPLLPVNPRRSRWPGRIPLDDVPAVVAGADIGIAPTRRDEFTDLSLSTKVYEYAAMGKAVVATRLPLVERTFPAGTVWSVAFSPDGHVLATGNAEQDRAALGR